MALEKDTYEIKFDFLNSLELKESFKAWLSMRDIHTFLESSLDDLDINPDEYDIEALERETQKQPIFIYRYSKKSLLDLQKEVKDAFDGKIKSYISVMPTSDWSEGWKDSFKRIETKLFEVIPPWDKAICEDKHTLTIEPAMAFGTGQHPTTYLCLKMLEKQKCLGSVIDIGSGTGILGIAAAKMGASRVLCTDICEDAVAAIQKNSAINGVECESICTDIVDEPFDLAMINILMPFFRENFSRLNKIDKLICSGILEENVAELKEIAKNHNYRYVSEMIHQDWACLEFHRETSV